MDSLSSDRHPIGYGPFAKAQAESAFTAVVHSLGQALGDPAVCGVGVDAWPSRSDGTLWLFLRGPDQIPRDTVAWNQQPQWGLLLVFDSTDRVGCRRAA